MTRWRLLTLVLTAGLLFSSCSTDKVPPSGSGSEAVSQDGDEAATATATMADEDVEPTATPDTAVTDRIVALSEEFLLADLLALGVRPIASTSNDPGGFVGLNRAETDGIEAIFSPEFNLERLAALRPDLLVVYQSYLDIGVVALGDLEAVADTVVIAESNDWRAQLLATGAALGRQDRAAELLVTIEADVAEARAELAGLEVSAVSVSPGPLIRAYTDERTALTEVLLNDLDIVLRPGPGADGTDDNGRLTLSFELLGQLDADVLVLLQSNVVPGEADALRDVKASPFWATLPAVVDGTVVELDRLAYPGALGVADFVRDLLSNLAG